MESCQPIKRLRDKKNFKIITITRKLLYQSSAANSSDMVQLITEEEFGAFICSETFCCETINYAILVSMLSKTDFWNY
jgi:hypothetical protein